MSEVYLHRNYILPLGTRRSASRAFGPGFLPNEIRLSSPYPRLDPGPRHDNSRTKQSLATLNSVTKYLDWTPIRGFCRTDLRNA